MFYRHVLAYLVLLAAYPHRHPSGGFREELLFAGAGIFGSTLYFLTENYALKYSMASNVGLLLATTPMLTAIVARFLTTGEPFNRQLAAGFCIAFLGVFLVIFNGHFILKLHPIGDFLAIAAALSWAFYSTLVKKIGNRYNGVRRFPLRLFTPLSAKYLPQPDLPRRHCIFALLFDLEQNHLENRPGRGQ